MGATLQINYISIKKKKKKKQKGLMRKEHSAPLQALIWLLESKGQAEAGFLP